MSVILLLVCLHSIQDYSMEPPMAMERQHHLILGMGHDTRTIPTDQIQVRHQRLKVPLFRARHPAVNQVMMSSTNIIQIHVTLP